MIEQRPLKVFLCHASADKPAVRRLYQRLVAEGWIDPWLDEEKLSFGQHWTTVIEDALDAADIVLIFLSRNSVQKEGFIQRELNYAWELSLEKPIETIFLIPFRLDDCEVPRRLRSRQWGDYFGDKEENTYQILLRSLKQRHEQKLRLETEEQKQHEVIEKVAREKAKQEAAEKLAREKAERETAEKLRREKTERDAAEKAAREKAEREDAEKAARQKAARETAEKAARQKAEREAAEKTAREKAEREAKEKSAREKAESDVAEKAKREIKIEPTVEKPVVTEFPSWGIGLIIFAVLALIAWGVSSIPVSPVATRTPSATQTLFVQPWTETPMSATVSATTEPLPTETPIPTSVLGIGSTKISEKDGMKLVFVPAGEFTMGSDTSSDEQPIHKVTLDAFWIDKTEVTNKMYALCVNAGACQLPSSMSSDTRKDYYGVSEFDDYPVIYVDWNKAKTYCEWAERRLPTEAEWEKAARGTDVRTYPWGNDAPNSNLLNYDSKVGDTTEVGKYPAGASIYGVLDMAGNVWEWVMDWYDSNYYSSSPSQNPQGPASGQYHVLRGGSWVSNVSGVRSALRGGYDPSNIYGIVGFRCALSK